MNQSFTVTEAGRKGGHARAQSLSKERIIEIAKLGGHARAKTGAKKKLKKDTKSA